MSPIPYDSARRTMTRSPSCRTGSMLLPTVVTYVVAPPPCGGAGARDGGLRRSRRAGHGGAAVRARVPGAAGRELNLHRRARRRRGVNGEGHLIEVARVRGGQRVRDG